MQHNLCKQIYHFYRYNKREEDFASQQNPLRSFNDYLEEVEDISEFVLCSPLQDIILSLLNWFSLEPG